MKKDLIVLSKEFNIKKPDARILYVCDRRACETCSFPECKHTTNIAHAKNFTLDKSGNFYEEQDTKGGYKMRDRLIELLKKAPLCNKDFDLQYSDGTIAKIADYLLENGVIVPPCKVGDTVAVRALCECIWKTPNYEECRHECPFEDGCKFEECNNSNEGIIVTQISSIYNDGDGWKVSFKNLCIEANIKDIGASFFVGKNAKEEAEKALAERNKQNE